MLLVVSFPNADAARAVASELTQLASSGEHCHTETILSGSGRVMTIALPTPGAARVRKIVATFGGNVLLEEDRPHAPDPTAVGSR